MIIAILTGQYSSLLSRLTSLAAFEEIVLVDFSKDSDLSDFSLSQKISYIKFYSWSQLKKDLTGIELLISYKLNKIIPIDIIDECRFGGLNIHPSLLPKYPGLNPWFKMYYDMELTGGVTIHKLTKHPDAGNIIAQQSFQIDPGLPLPIAMRRAEDVAMQLLTNIMLQRLYLAKGKEQEIQSNRVRNTLHLDSLKQLPVKRLWHLLRGFPSLIKVLYPTLPHRYFEVGEYTSDNQDKERFRISEIDIGRLRINCRDGDISLWDFSRIPMTQDYLDALKSSDFTDEILSKVNFEKDIDKSYIYIQGREAIIFPATIDHKRIGIRFLRNILSEEIDEYVTRLDLINHYIHQSQITHFTEYKVIPKAIKLSKGIFPAILMKWQSGDNLISYIRSNLAIPKVLNALLSKFIEICKTNHKNGIVHGDIHSGNMIIQENRNITILDIDNLWIPSFGETEDKGGNRNYQHPLRMRNKNVFEGLDNFSEIIVYATIRTAIYAPDLFIKYSDNECLFRYKDYNAPYSSSILRELKERDTLASLGKMIIKICDVTDIQDIPALETITSHKI